MKKIYDKLMAPYEQFAPVDDVEGIRRVCSQTKYALVTNTFNLMNLGFVPNCTLTYIPEAFIPVTIALAITQNSPYKELFNQK